MTVPLQLFDLQQKAIVSLPMAASPHFLKIFLTSLAWAVTEGFDIHVLFEQWLAVDSLAQLLEAVVRCMETGFLPDEQSRMDAKQFLMENNYNVMLAQDALVRRKSSNRPPGQYLERTASRPSTPVDDILGIAVPGAASTEFGYRDARLQGQFAAPPGERRAVVELNFDVVELPQASQDQAEAGNHKPNTPVATMSRTNSLHETKEMFVSTSHSTTRSATGSGSSGPDASGGIVPGVSPLGLLSTSARRQTKRASFDGINVSMTTSAPKLIPGTKELPVYLSGGRYVPPLGELLGQALCLLYVSRHGMLVNELRYILNAVVLDTRENEQQNQLHRKSSFSNVRNMGDDSSLTAFSEDEWKALMRAMRPLGLLFFQNVIVLPICKEVVRDLVWWRYIGSEKVEQQYHQWMIRFFRIHPTTFRRVEELPWHLKRCFQWDALRHVLVNLAMFQLLYTANFKTELFGYWKTLTDGPLLLYNTDPPVFTKPFDIVREYGRSIDDWYRSARPPTKTFTPIVQLVTKFMHEFSLYYQGTLPPFQHAPFELRRLYQDGFTFVEDLPHVHSFNSASAIAASASSSAAAAAPASPTQGSLVSTPAMMPVSGPSTALLAALDAFASLGQTSAGSKDKEVLGNWFSFYQRWIWIHFPWLALGKEIVLRDPVVTGITVFPASQSNNSQLGSGLLGSLSSPGGADLAGLASLDSLDHHHNVSHGQDGPPSSPVHGGRGSGGAIHLDTHFWDVKKSMLEAAEIGLKGVPSAAKISALQNSSIAASTATTQTLDVISPDNVFHKKATYAAVKNVLSSSVRSLPTAIANTTGPGGLSSVPELTGAGGATFLTEQALSPLQVTTDTGLTIEAPSITAQDAFAMSSKKTIAPLATHEIGMDRLTTNDNVGSMPTAFGLPAHAHDYPQTEWDLKKSYNLQVMLKLQTLYDSVKVEVHRKQSYLHTVKLKIADTAKRYELTMRECDMARHAMEEMSMRMNKLEAVVCNIDRQEKAHRKLIRSCELFPACNPSHFEDLKKELRLLQMKLKDLTAEKRMLHSKKVHLQGVEVPALQKAIARNKELLGAVVDKLEKAREKMMQEQAASDKLYQRRVEMIESVRTTDYKDTEASLVQKTSEAAEHATSATTRSLAAKVALQQCESMCEKIQKATGFTKLELILQKFVSREELNRSFEEQAKIYEARLKQIKMHQAELEQQLRSLEVSSAVPPTDDPRMLDEKLRVAEVELARIERTQNNLLTTSKEVIAGASRIIKLMGITSCNSPYKNAIPAAQLWPPPQGIDGENSLMSEFETLEPKEIAQLLQICQDRAMSMIDMVSRVPCCLSSLMLIDGWLFGDRLMEGAATQTQTLNGSTTRCHTHATASRSTTRRHSRPIECGGIMVENAENGALTAASYRPRACSRPSSRALQAATTTALATRSRTTRRTRPRTAAQRMCSVETPSRPPARASSPRRSAPRTRRPALRASPPAAAAARTISTRVINTFRVFLWCLCQKF